MWNVSDVETLGRKPVKYVYISWRKQKLNKRWSKMRKKVGYRAKYGSLVSLINWWGVYEQWGKTRQGHREQNIISPGIECDWYSMKIWSYTKGLQLMQLWACWKEIRLRLSQNMYVCSCLEQTTKSFNINCQCNTTFGRICYKFKCAIT